MHTHAYTNMYGYTHIHSYAHIHTCICTHTCTHKHTGLWGLKAKLRQTEFQEKDRTMPMNAQARICGKGSCQSRHSASDAWGVLEGGRKELSLGLRNGVSIYITGITGKSQHIPSCKEEVGFTQPRRPRKLKNFTTSTRPTPSIIKPEDNFWERSLPMEAPGQCAGSSGMQAGMQVP